jgi:hypothetical protein
VVPASAPPSGSSASPSGSSAGRSGAPATPTAAAEALYAPPSCFSIRRLRPCSSPGAFSFAPLPRLAHFSRVGASCPVAPPGNARVQSWPQCCGCQRRAGESCGGPSPGREPAVTEGSGICPGVIAGGVTGRPCRSRGRRRRHRGRGPAAGAVPTPCRCRLAAELPPGAQARPGPGAAASAPRRGRPASLPQAVAGGGPTDVF